MTEYTPTVEEWIAANTVPCAANGEEHDCSYEYLYVEVETARAFLAAVERAAAAKALREAADELPYMDGSEVVSVRRLRIRADRIESGEQA